MLKEYLLEIRKNLKSIWSYLLQKRCDALGENQILFHKPMQYTPSNRCNRAEVLFP